MAAKPPSTRLRALLRARINRRIAELNLGRADAAALRLAVRMTATRPYGQ